MPAQKRVYSNIVQGYKRVSSVAGQRIDPIDGTSKEHKGIDLATPVGTPIRAPANAQVWSAGEGASGYGNYLILAHPDNVNPVSWTMYAHLESAPSLEIANNVLGGQLIATSGNVGRGTGPHLHYEERSAPGRSLTDSTDNDKNYRLYVGLPYLNPDANPLGFAGWDPSQLPRSSLTKDERVGQLILSDAEFDAYKDALATIESHGKSLSQSYMTVSASGKLLGRYQFGSGALKDAGYKDGDGGWSAYARSQGVDSDGDFLSHPAAQDDALRRYTDRNTTYLVVDGADLRIGDVINGKSVTGPGLLLGSHNSRGNLLKYLSEEGAVDPVDGNGFRISNYVNLGATIVADDVVGGTRALNGAARGHWENEVIYTDLGVPLTTQSVWVADASVAAPVKPPGPSNHTTKGAVYLSRDGLSVTLPNGKQVSVGAGGRIDLEPDGTITVTKTIPAMTTDGAQAFDVVRMSRSGVELGHVQVQVISDPSKPDDRTRDVAIVQGQSRDFAMATADGTAFHVRAVFQIGAGWVDPNTGEVILDTKTWSQFREAGTESFPLSGATAPPELPEVDLREISDPDGFFSSQSEVGGDDVDGDDPDDYGGSDADQSPMNSAASAVSLMNSIVGLQHWNSMTDLQRTAAVVSIYNAADAMTGSNSLPGNLCAAASMLGLLNALDQGNIRSALISGISLVDGLADGAASQMIGAALGVEAASVVPGLGLAFAIESGDPVAILAAAVNFIPVYGQILSVIITLVSSILGEVDLPTHEGLAHAQWDGDGHIQVITDLDTEGGGPTATSWMNALANGLQHELSKDVDSAGNPRLALIPDLLPAIGYAYDPDGANFRNAEPGHLYLRWIDENGQAQTRYYDGAGNRADGTGETLVADFMTHALEAIAPAWAVQTAFSHWQQGQGLHLPTEKADLPQQSVDGLHQTLQAMTLTRGSATATGMLSSALADVDHDGYLEATDWVSGGQSVLVIDANMDGVIDTTELLTLRDGAALNNMRWLDANGDNVLDANDPGFAQLRLWLDANGDAISNGETVTLEAAGIASIDFGRVPPQVVRSDGSREDLTVQTLTAEVLGAKYAMTQGGLLETSEQLDGTGASVLAAANTREFDGQAAHVHGGSAVAVQIAQGDGRISNGQGGRVLSGQDVEGEADLAVVSVDQLVASTGQRRSQGNRIGQQLRAKRPGTASWMAMALAAGAAAATPHIRADQQQPDSPQERAIESTDADVGRDVLLSQSETIRAQVDGPDQRVEHTRIQGASGRAPHTPQSQSWHDIEWASHHIQLEAERVAPEVSATGFHQFQAHDLDRDLKMPSGFAGPDTSSLGRLAPRVNSAPRVADEVIASREDQRLNIDPNVLLANDVDDDMPHDPLRVISVGNSHHGTVTMDSGGAIHFIPDLDFFGTASFSYEVDDLEGGTRTGVATIEIEAVNDAPKLVGEAITLAEDTEVRFTPGSLLANDSDVDNAWNELSIASVGNALNGAVSLVNGEVVFKPTDDYYGPASFTYTVDAELGARLFRHLLRLPLSYFESRKTGDTVARIRELDNARHFLTGSALTSWLDLLFALIFIGVMFNYSVTLTMIVIASLPVIFGASLIVTPLMRRKLEDKSALSAENQSFLAETVGTMETLKSQAVEGLWQSEWERRQSKYVQAAFGSGHLGNATNQFISLSSKLLSVLLLYFGAKLVIEGELTVGGLIAFNMLASRVNAPILKLASVWQEITQLKVSIKRLGDIMDASPEPVFDATRTMPPILRGDVAFDNVSFRYASNGPEVLSGVSLNIGAGEVIGLTGISGSGKTTLTRLIQRLYVPERGRILLDGMDIGLVDARWLRRQIGVVGQDSALFNKTVRENIALSRPELEIEAIIESAKLAGAHEFILQLPRGYDTVVGERGSKLSGGQRSRIAIARALAGDPRILLLDEATAALDYESEQAVHENMRRICEGRTVFIVAHRLSTLRLANRVLVLENGRLIESGNHRDLLRVNGRYASLFRAHQMLEAA